MRCVLIGKLATVHTVSVTSVEVLVIYHRNDYSVSVERHTGRILVVPSSAAVVTDVVLYVTVCGTGRSYSLYVSESVRCVLIGKLIAIHTVSITGIEVFVRKLGICVGTSVGFVTVVALGGFCAVSLTSCIIVGYVVGKAMTGSGNNLLTKKNIAADRALLTVGQAGIGASGCLACDGLFIVLGAKVSATNIANVIVRILVGMTGSGDLILRNKSVATYRADRTVGKTVLGTGGSLAAHSLGAMSKSVSAVVNIAVATYGAGVGGIATVFTVGLGN